MSSQPESRSRSIHTTLPPPRPLPDAKPTDYPAPNARRRVAGGDFNTAMIHFYRGEVQRANAWRNRLDTTTNWAVVTAGATLSFAFGSANNPHFVIIINSLIVGYFLFMEGRRYRYYEIWANRVRVLERWYLGQILTGDKGIQPRPANTQEHVDWTEYLAKDLHTPHFTISELEAIGRRLRRNYLWIFVLLALSWNLKVYLHPTPAVSFEQFIARAAVGSIPGSVVFITGIVFNVSLFIFALATVKLREATGEVLPEHDFSFHPIQRVTAWNKDRRTDRAQSRRTERARLRSRARPAGRRADRRPPDDIHETVFPNVPEPEPAAMIPDIGAHEAATLLSHSD